MDNKFNYTGKVTVKSIFRDKVISTQHYNSGTIELFQVYAKALTGQSITNFLPSYIDVEVSKDGGNSYNSCLVSDKGVSVVRSYVDLPSPCARFTTTLTNDMFNSNTFQNLSAMRFCLKTSPLPVSREQQVLAKISIDLSDNDSPFESNGIPSGTQIIIVWDLYVENKEVPNQ